MKNTREDAGVVERAGIQGKILTAIRIEIRTATIIRKVVARAVVARAVVARLVAARIRITKYPKAKS
jgi:hypothetical protein